MDKSELIREIQSKAKGEYKLNQIEDILNSFINVVTKEVATGGKVRLIGFGSFEAVERKERKGRNPQTGEMIEIPGCNIPKFKAGKDFKDALK